MWSSSRKWGAEQRWRSRESGTTYFRLKFICLEEPYIYGATKSHSTLLPEIEASEETRCCGCVAAVVNSFFLLVLRRTEQKHEGRHARNHMCIRDSPAKICCQVGGTRYAVHSRGLSSGSPPRLPKQ